MFFKKKTNKNIETADLEFGGSNDSLGKFVFVLNIEDVDNELKIILSGYVEGEKGSGVDEELDEAFKEILKESTPIYPDEDDVYEIVFPSYIIYQVRNESYCSWDDYNIRTGNRLYIYEKSKLLDYFKSVTDCCQSNDGDYYPGEWIHYGIDAEDHIIDIISHEKPIIKKISN